MVKLNGLSASEALRACKYPCSRKLFAYHLGKLEGHDVPLALTKKEITFIDAETDNMGEVSSPSTIDASKSSPSTYTDSVASDHTKSNRRKLFSSSGGCSVSSLTAQEETYGSAVVTIEDS